MKSAVVSVVAVVLFSAIAQGHTHPGSKKGPDPLPAKGHGEKDHEGHEKKDVQNFPFLPCGPAPGPKPNLPKNHNGHGPVPGPKHGRFTRDEHYKHKHMHAAEGPAPHGHGPHENLCMEPALPTLPKKLPAKGDKPGPTPGPHAGEPGNNKQGRPRKPFHDGRKMM